MLRKRGLACLLFNQLLQPKGATQRFLIVVMQPGSKKIIDGYYQQ